LQKTEVEAQKRGKDYEKRVHGSPGSPGGKKQDGGKKKKKKRKKKEKKRKKRLGDQPRFQETKNPSKKLRL